MHDDHRFDALQDALIERLLEHDDAWIDHSADDTAPDVPAGMAIVRLAEGLHVYVGRDPGELASGRVGDPEVLVLSACVATELHDLGAAEAIIAEFRAGASLPDDVVLAMTSNGPTQLWIDRRATATTSCEVALATLHDLVTIAIDLRARIAHLDAATSFDARSRADDGGHRAPVSFDLIDERDWHSHPWLTRLEPNSDIDGNRHLCLYGLALPVAEHLARIDLQRCESDGTWSTITAELPGPAMPARDWEQPSVAWWCDGPGPWRARVPTGWVGPPV